MKRKTEMEPIPKFIDHPTKLDALFARKVQEALEVLRRLRSK